MTPKPRHALNSSRVSAAAPLVGCAAAHCVRQNFGILNSRGALRRLDDMRCGVRVAPRRLYGSRCDALCAQIKHRLGELVALRRYLAMRRGVRRNQAL